MFGQSFAPGDLGTVAFLVVLEALLSADNALVLAIMVKHLPPNLRQKALLYGLGGAFVFRFIAILIAGVLIAFWWLQAIGAAYLLYLPIKHFIHASGGLKRKPKEAGFWATVISVELADIAFAVDSVLAGVATIGSDRSKIWVVYFGAIIGVVLLRFAAGIFIRILERLPALDHVAYVIVGWVGVKLSMMAAHNYGKTNPSAPFHVNEMSHVVFWSILIVIAALGTAYALKHPAPVEAAQVTEAELAEVADASDMSLDSPTDARDSS